MDIRVLKTEDKNQRIFELDVPISVGEKVYSDSISAMKSPIAGKIFGFSWTDSVKVSQKSLTVSTQDWVNWELIEEPLKDLLIEHFSGRENIEENPESVHKTLPPSDLNGNENPSSFKKELSESHTDSPGFRKIQKLIEDEINPALASHGGFVNLHSVRGDQAFIEMGGGCQGCAMSYMTLKEGIEEAIKKAVPEIKGVIDITDHDEGQNPYYE